MYDVDLLVWWKLSFLRHSVSLNLRLRILEEPPVAFLPVVTMIPSYELSPTRADNYRKRFHRVSRRHHGSNGSKSMFSDARRKSCITEFEEDLGKAAKNPFQELFAKFCSSSTIHGTYFWIASGSHLARAAWGLIGTVHESSLIDEVLNSSFDEKIRKNSWNFAYISLQSTKFISSQRIF